MKSAVATPGTTPTSVQSQPEAKRTVVRWLDPVWSLTLGPVLVLFGAPGLVLEPWMPWQPFIGITLLGLSFGWRVVVWPSGVTVSRTLLGIPFRFHRLGPRVAFLPDDGFEGGPSGIEVLTCGGSFLMGAWRRHVHEEAYELIVEGIEHAGLETEPLFANSFRRRVIQPGSTPITF